MSEHQHHILVQVENEEIPDGLAYLVREAALAALILVPLPAATQLTVFLTDSQTLRRLNRQFNHLDEETDVLSFPSGTSMPGAPAGGDYLGDIAISVPYAATQAGKGQHSLADEIQLLTVHGVLHLLGFDHRLPDEKAIMWRQQSRALQRLGLGHIVPREE